MTDFNSWLHWYRTHHNPSITTAAAKQAYDEYYFCDCETCTHRKEHGYQPVARIHLQCKLPTNRPPLVV